MDPIAIGQGACNVVFDDPMLAVAWVKTLVHVYTPDFYMQLFKALHQGIGQGDAISEAQHMVDICFGTPS